jgi:replicative DNA helicase
MKEILLKEIEAIFKQDEKSDKELCVDLIKTIRKHEKNQLPDPTVETLSSLFNSRLNKIINGEEMESNISTGFDNIDRIIGGFSYGELVLIAARPGMGKTSLLMMLSLKISKQSPVLFITFSMTAKEITKRFNSILTGISFKSNDNFSESEILILQDLADEIGQYKIHLSDDCHRNIAALKDLCIQQVKENGVRCVFFDNIQTINSSRYYQNRHQELEYIMHELKQLAKQLDICIILDSQLSRAVETRGGTKRPMMSDLRDSGALENIADKVVFIYRPEYYEIVEDEYGNDTRGTAEIIISKNTSGPIGTAKLAFIARTASFRDIDDTEIVPFDSSFTFDNKRLKDLDDHTTPPF